MGWPKIDSAWSLRMSRRRSPSSTHFKSTTHQSLGCWFLKSHYQCDLKKAWTQLPRDFWNVCKWPAINRDLTAVMLGSEIWFCKATESCAKFFEQLYMAKNWRCFSEREAMQSANRCERRFVTTLLFPVWLRFCCAFSRTASITQNF